MLFTYISVKYLTCRCMRSGSIFGVIGQSTQLLVNTQRLLSFRDLLLLLAAPCHTSCRLFFIHVIHYCLVYHGD